MILCETRLASLLLHSVQGQYIQVPIYSSHCVDLRGFTVYAVREIEKYREADPL